MPVKELDSLSKNPLNWKKEEVKLEDQQNITKVFTKDNVIQKEFNSDLKLDLSNIVLIVEPYGLFISFVFSI